MSSVRGNYLNPEWRFTNKVMVFLKINLAENVWNVTTATSCPHSTNGSIATDEWNAKKSKQYCWRLANCMMQQKTATKMQQKFQHFFEKLLQNSVSETDKN